MDAARRKAIHEAMVRLSDGDRTAFDILVDDLWPVILSFAERAVGQTADAEDIAQEVFYRICARIADFDRKRDGVSWAFGIASYEVMTHRRRLQRLREVSDDHAVAVHVDSSASQEEQLLNRELENAFTQTVGALTEDDRVSLGLRNGVIDVSGAALRKRKQRAFGRLQGIWRQFYGDP